MTIARHSIYNLAGALAPLVLALVTIPLYISLIGGERYGILAIAWLILGYFGIFDLGLGRATTHRMAALANASREARAALFCTASLANAVIGVLGGLLLWLSAESFLLYFLKADGALLAEAVEALPYLACGVPIATLTCVASGALQGRSKFLEVNLASVVGASLFQLLPLAFAYWLGVGLKDLITAAIIARLIGLVIFMSLAYRDVVRGARWRIAPDEGKRLLRYGGWVTIVAMVSPLMVAVDRLFIGALISAVAVATYSVAFEIVQRVSILPRSIAIALFPRMAQLDGEASTALVERALRTINALVTPLCVVSIMFIRPFLELWIGPEIGDESGVVAIIVLLGFWTNAFGILSYNRLQATGRPHLVAFVLLSQVPLYLVALYFAVSAFGLIGAAATFAVRTTIDALLLHRFSSGGWSVPPILFGSAVIIVGAAVFNLLFPTFSLAWLASAATLLVGLALTFRHQVPCELRDVVSRWIPTPLFKHIRFV